MAAWLPIIRSAIPIVAELISVARPIFTQKTGAEKADAVVPEQIAELQDAATRNSETIKELAVQLKSALEGIETAAAEMQQQLERQRRLSRAALGCAVSALIIAVLLVWR